MREHCSDLSKIIEKQFIGFIMKSVQGLKLDYLRRQRKFDTEIPTDQLEAYLQKTGDDYSILVFEKPMRCGH